jgi:GT2 family glycosyltransferase
MIDARVTIVIVNWNGLHWLQQFLPLLYQRTDAPFHLLAIDNASKDDSVSWLRERFPQAEVQVMPHNLGFAGGNNAALPFVKTPYLLLLNSDVEVTEGWLSPLVAYMDAHPGMAAVQPKLKAWRAQTDFEYAGAAGGFIDALGYPFCRGRIFNVLEEDQGQYENPIPVFWTSGACMLIRTDAVAQVGLLEEGFFAHMEEIDFCWRLQNAGWRLAAVPASTVYHVGGGTLPQGNPRKVYLNYRNGLWMMARNLPFPQLVPLLFVRMVLDGVAALRELLKGDWRYLLAVLRAHGHFYQRIPLIIAHRKKARIRPFHQLEGVYKGSIVWAHFFRRVRKWSDLRIGN